jgi:hypothetical protein
MYLKSLSCGYFNRICLVVTLSYLMWLIYSRSVILSLWAVSVSYTTEMGPVECFFIHLYSWYTDTAIVVLFDSDMLLWIISFTEGSIMWYSVPTTFFQILSQVWICHETMIMSDTAKRLAIKWSVTKIINKMYNYFVFSIIFYFTYTVYTFEILFSWCLYISWLVCGFGSWSKHTN